jgi:hypothetical protein
MSQEYPNGGSIRPSTRKTSERAADYFGSVDIDGDVMEYIVQCARNGTPATVELGGWKKQGSNGPFISLRGSIPYSVRQGQQDQQPRQQQSRQQDQGYQQQGRQQGRQQNADFFEEPQQQRRQPQGNQRQQYSQQGTGRPQQNFRQDLNDDIPDFGSSRNQNQNSNGWDD